MEMNRGKDIPCPTAEIMAMIAAQKYCRGDGGVISEGVGRRVIVSDILKKSPVSSLFKKD